MPLYYSYHVIYIMPDKCSYMQSQHLLKVLTKNIPIQAHWKNMPVVTFLRNDIPLLLVHFAALQKVKQMSIELCLNVNALLRLKYCIPYTKPYSFDKANVKLKCFYVLLSSFIVTHVSMDSQSLHIKWSAVLGKLLTKFTLTAIWS